MTTKSKSPIKTLLLIIVMLLMTLNAQGQMSAIYDIVVFNPQDGRADQLAISIMFTQVPPNPQTITIQRNNGLIIAQVLYRTPGNLILLGDYLNYTQGNRDFQIRVDTYDSYYYEEEIFETGNRYYPSDGEYLCDFPDPADYFDF